MGKYMIDIEKNKIRFKEIVGKYIHLNGINELVEWLETTDFFTAPSSARYHGAEPGGLCEHSLAVYDRLKNIQADESDETIAIVSLFHDLCKVNFYKQSYRNVKNDETGKWERVPSYDYADQLPLGHGEKSMFLLMKYIRLTDEEALAIRWHMGGYMSMNRGESSALADALTRYPIVLKLQIADQQAAFWDGK